MAASLLLLPRPPPSPRFSPFSLQNLHQIPSNFKPSSRFPSFNFRPLFSISTKALTESSDSPKSLDPPDYHSLLQQLADTFDLPPDYFSQLPRDLRLDLNDAAFDLSNGPVIDQCGEELGMTLLNISRAWESVDTSGSMALVKTLPQMADSLTNNNKAALGKRLVSAGRRFESMGQYGQGELQRISKAMISTGTLLSKTPASETEEPKDETRMLKFGELQVELTREKAYIGTAIAFVYGILTWELSQGIGSIPDSSFHYANDNASTVAKSLLGALLVICYGSTALSGFAVVGLFLLARQLKSEKK